LALMAFLRSTPLFRICLMISLEFCTWHEDHRGHLITRVHSTNMTCYLSLWLLVCGTVSWISLLLSLFAPFYNVPLKSVHYMQMGGELYFVPQGQSTSPGRFV
jgi:hypothetical protein